MTPAEPDFLTVDDVMELHRDQLNAFGGTAGIRDRGALESAVGVPSATFDGEFLHAGLFEMAAAYAFHIAENQPFLDGNKRTALNAALVFLGINGWTVLDPTESLYDAMIAFATRTLQKPGCAAIFESLSSAESGGTNQ